MNDLHFIFYEPKRMFLDTSDMSCEAANAHRRLCDFIWFNDGPPQNQNKTLKQITLTDESDWSAVKRELLRKGWLEINEFFLHRGAIKSLNESKVKYVENFNRQAKMNKAVPLKLSAPDAVTGIVTIIVTLPVTPNVTPMQSESQPESESEKTYSSLKAKKGDVRGKEASCRSPRPTLGTSEEHSTLNIQCSTSNAAVAANSEPLLRASNMGEIVSWIQGNHAGWAYDNCKVAPSEFTVGGLKTVMYPFLGKVTCAQCKAAWLAAVKEAHAFTVDGMTKSSPAAVCTGAWKRLMAEADGQRPETKPAAAASA